MTLIPGDRPVIGVDVGGTKIAAGVVDRSGAILQQIRTPMAASAGASAGLAAVTSAIQALAHKMGGGKFSEMVRGIGICSPGPLDPEKGVVINPPNLPCWRN